MAVADGHRLRRDVKKNLVIATETTLLVNTSGIAEKIGVARSTAANYPKRYKDFPEPLEAPGVIGIKLYFWPDVESWFNENFATRNQHGFGQGEPVEIKEEETP